MPPRTKDVSADGIGGDFHDVLGGVNRAAAIADLVAVASADATQAVDPLAAPVPIVDYTPNGQVRDWTTVGRKSEQEAVTGTVTVLVRCSTYARQFVVDDDFQPGRKVAVAEVSHRGDTLVLPNDHRTKLHLAEGYLILLEDPAQTTE